MPMNHLIPDAFQEEEEVRKAMGLGCLRPQLPQNPAGRSMWQGPEWMGFYCAPSMADIHPESSFLTHLAPEPLCSLRVML